MSNTLTIPNNFTDGTDALASDVNANFTAISTFLNSTKLNDDNIQSGGISAPSIASDSITTIKILDANVTLAKLAAASVNRSKLVTGALNPVVVTKSADYTATTAEQVILVNAAGGAVTITLPAASTNDEVEFVVKKTDSSTNAVTVSCSENIDGASTLVLREQYESVKVVAKSSTWNIEARQGMPSPKSYTPGWTGSVVNPVLGNGAIVGFYHVINKRLWCNIQLTVGSTTTFGSGDWQFAIPSHLTIDSSKITTVNNRNLGPATLVDNGTDTYPGTVVYADTTGVKIWRIQYSAGTGVVQLSNASVGSATPFTWETGDLINLTFEVPIV